MRYLIIIILCGASFTATAQSWHLSDNISKKLLSLCPVCSPVTASAASESFHRCHITLASSETDSAYAYALQTIATCNPLQDSLLMVASLFIKARILYYKSVNEQALTVYNSIHTHDKDIAAATTANMAEIYLQQSNFQAALQHFNDWQSRFAAGADPYILKTIYSNTATCLLHMERYKEAWPYYEKSLVISVRIKDTTGLAQTYMNMANWYYNQYKDKEAAAYFNKALFFALRSHDHEIIRDIYLNMAQIAEDAKKYTNALSYRKLYEATVDTIWNRDKIFATAEQEKKLAVKLLQESAIRQRAELEKRRWQRNTFLLLAIFFLTSAGLIYFAYRQKTRQKNTLAELNQTKDQLFSIVAHDLRSPVANLKINLHYLKTALTENRITQALALSEKIETISNSTHMLLNNLLHWALGQTGRLVLHQEVLHLQAITEQVCYDYIPVAATRNITIRNETPAGLYFFADSNTVKIILRNLLDNAIKYTPAEGHVSISAAILENTCQITVADSGAGMDAATLHAIQHNLRHSSGIGLWLSRQMAEKNGGTLHIDSDNNGTRITLHLLLPS
ncbi:Signal transduction histidine kinase [Chitinophaga sp. CF118]|uniref:tetratricopeptide repeat-containing sensor histidine kinase n=1 Tax=Chitinophaga sp. CF118 TaxID=1884367 RepID=UPI0008E8A83C|nr:tetratricopeptide repeat-containing sensor histidine kinase [Chitinophaga sp. CF118]SFD78200.1 Signal transduction histidine kinase [Chitinophaga sp. CF118]